MAYVEKFVKGEKMLNKVKTENITRAYIHSYNIAMEITKNPDFAVQIALNVIIAMLAVEPKEPMFNPFQAVIEQMAAQVHKEGSEKEYDRTENEAD